MKSSLLFICLFFSVTCVAQRLYVTPTGTSIADGGSWDDALSLEAALKQAVSGNQIWVMQGEYKPNEIAGRKASFIVPAGVELYGGFAGNETTLFDRQAEATSTLSGNVGTPDVSDNVYTVVTLASDGVNVTSLDGFVVTGGNSRNFKEGLNKGNAGGGLYIMASENLSSHMISNCVFEANMAHNGGGVLIDTGRPSFVNCKFKANKADFNGGAVYSNGIASLASPIFRDCVFEGNSSNSGAGITNNGTNGEASPLLLGCDFINNASLMNGAAIYNISNDDGATQTIIEDCSFVGNDSILGDDISDNGVSRAVAEKIKKNSGGSLRPTIVRK